MSNNVIFADQLRVLAFLSVMIVHWFGSFWMARDMVAKAIFAPPAEGKDPGFYKLLMSAFLPDFNYGPFGIAIFFEKWFCHSLFMQE